MKNKLNGLIRKTISVFGFNIKEIVFFEIIYKILTIFILLPLSFEMMRYSMKLNGFESLTNKDVLRFGCSFIGAISLFLFLVISFCMIFFEISFLTYVSAMSHKRKKVNIIDGIFNSFTCVRASLDRAVIPLIIITGVIGPLTGIGLCSSIVRNFSIPPFITIELTKTLGGKVLLLILGIVVVGFLLRWVLALPTIVIEDIKGKEAIKKSYKMYKKNRIALLKALSIWIIFNAIGVVATFIGIIASGKIIAFTFGENSSVSGALLVALLAIFYIFYIFISIIWTPLFISYLVTIYYELRGSNIKERKNCGHNSIVYEFFNRYKNVFIVTVTFVFIIFSAIYGYNLIFKNVINKNIEITGHRGTITAPENTLIGVKLAKEEGANYAEIDVMLSKDSEVFLFHDKDLKRINGSTKSIKELNSKEIEKVDAGSYHSIKYKGEKIPKLSSVLKYAKGNIKLNIELKPCKDEEELAKKVVNLIEENKMVNDVTVTSINYKALQEVKKLNPKIKTGYIVLAAFGNYAKLDVDFFSMESSLVTQKKVFAIHALGKEVHVFTVNNQKLANKMIYLGVDNIITDNIELIKNIKTELLKNKEFNYMRMYYEGVVNILEYGNL